MKVLHICPGYFGAEIYEKLFSALQNIELDNEIFTLPFNNISSSGESTFNLRVWEKSFNVLDRVIYFRKQYLIYNFICKEYSINEFNIVHAHTLFSAGYSAYLLCKKFKVPYIVAIRNTDVNIFFKYMLHLRGLGREILNNAQNIIFLSPSYRDFVIDKYIDRKSRPGILDKSVVIPNGIDEYFLQNKSVVIKATDIKYIKLIYVGDIDTNKNIETTVKACRFLIEKGYSVIYTVVGEILDSNYSRIFANNSFIIYHPRCPKEDVLLYLRCSDIFVMPSVTETFGIVYAEAMSQGLPVVYSKGQGFDGQFEDGVVGYAVKCFDYEDIAKRIIELYHNYKQFSERSVALVDKFKWSTIAKEYERIYR